MTAENKNEEKFMEILGKMRPDLWSIEMYRQELKFKDISWLKEVLKSVFNIAVGSGTGESIIEVRGRKLIRIRGRETTHVDEALF